MSLGEFKDENDEDDEKLETMLCIIVDMIYAIAVMMIIIIGIFYFISDLQQYDVDHSVKTEVVVIDKD